jgi:hypothetical protein
MHMADSVRMCIDMGIDVGSEKRVTVANDRSWFMALAYKTKPAAGWPRSAGAGRLECVWLYRSTARTTPIRMPIPMGIGIDMRVLRPINIVLQDDRDGARMSMNRIRNSEFRIRTAGHWPACPIGAGST